MNVTHHIARSKQAKTRAIPIASKKHGLQGLLAFHYHWRKTFITSCLSIKFSSIPHWISTRSCKFTFSNRNYKSKISRSGNFLEIFKSATRISTLMSIFLSYILICTCMWNLIYVNWQWRIPILGSARNPQNLRILLLLQNVPLYLIQIT